MARKETPPETSREAIAAAYAADQDQAKLREELTTHAAPNVHPAVLEELRALMFRHRYQSVIRNAIQARISELERQARRGGQ